MDSGTDCLVQHSTYSRQQLYIYGHHIIQIGVCPGGRQRQKGSKHRTGRCVCVCAVRYRCHCPSPLPFPYVDAFPLYAFCLLCSLCCCPCDGCRPNGQRAIRTTIAQLTSRKFVKISLALVALIRFRPIRQWTPIQYQTRRFLIKSMPNRIH